jgi:hypothetical protein
MRGGGGLGWGVEAGREEGRASLLSFLFVSPSLPAPRPPHLAPQSHMGSRRRAASFVGQLHIPLEKRAWGGGGKNEREGCNAAEVTQRAAV